MGQFSKVWTIRGSLEHISAFNPSINPISAVEAAVDDSLIQADTGRGIHEGRKAFNSILPSAHQQGWNSLMWMQKGLPIAKSNCNINQLQRIKSSFLCHGWLACWLPVVFIRWIIWGLCSFVRKWNYLTSLWYLHIDSKTMRFSCSGIHVRVATSYKCSILNVCWTPVDTVTQNQPCINGERSSIMSQSGWKQPPIKTIRGQSMRFHPQDGNCTHMAQTLWRSPIQSQIINIKLAGKKSKCQSALQSLGRWELPLFLIQFHSAHIYSRRSLL